MTETHTMGRELQDEVLNTVRKSQTVVIEAIHAWASKAQSITSELPSMPSTDTLPKPQELIAGSYDFAEQLLASQRTFAQDVLKAIAPLTAGKNGAPATKNGAA